MRTCTPLYTGDDVNNDETLSWHDVQWLCSQTSLPVIVKGVCMLNLVNHLNLGHDYDFDRDLDLDLDLDRGLSLNPARGLQGEWPWLTLTLNSSIALTTLPYRSPKNKPTPKLCSKRKP